MLAHRVMRFRLLLTSGLALGFLLNTSGETARAFDLGVIRPDLSTKKADIAVAKNADLEKEVTAIFKKSCTDCHSGANAAAGLDVTDFNKIRTGQSSSGVRYVNAAEPEKSLFYQQVATDLMPKFLDKLSTSNKATILAWIRESLPKSEPGKPARKLISETSILKQVLERLEVAGPLEVKKLKYVSFHTLHNNPAITEQELETARKGLFKLLNSLSWNRKIILPEALDSDRTLYEIDIDQLGWNASSWERLMALYPYSIELREPGMDRLKKLTGSTLPWVRGDWLVFKAARPPLYHDLLQLPASKTSDSDLERALGIDVRQNLADGTAVRAGFRGGKFGSKGSGVSDHNRLIERHATRYGSYWKSYDFSASEGEQDLLNRPLGAVPSASSDFSFKHAGGEIIFNLPNGMQAYLLTDASGVRLDEGPIEIVRDKTHGGRPVVNGISCISCHSQGMNRQFDQVLNFSNAHPERFDRVQPQIEKLYRPDSELKALFDQDDAVFRKAVKAAQAEDGTREPVTVTSDQFEEPLDMQKAAAELGMNETTLRNALKQRSQLGALRSALETGGITRDGFIDTFKTLVSELELGTPAPGTLVQSKDEVALSNPNKNLNLEEAKKLADFATARLVRFFGKLKKHEEEFRRIDQRGEFRHRIEFSNPLRDAGCTTKVEPKQEDELFELTSDAGEQRHSYLIKFLTQRFDWTEIRRSSSLLIQPIKNPRHVANDPELKETVALGITSAGIPMAELGNVGHPVVIHTGIFGARLNNQNLNKSSGESVFFRPSDDLILAITTRREAEAHQAELQNIANDLIRACTRIKQGR